MTCAEAELAFRGRGPPPVPRRMSRVTRFCAAADRWVIAAENATPARNLRRLMLRIEDPLDVPRIISRGRGGQAPSSAAMIMMDATVAMAGGTNPARSARAGGQPRARRTYRSPSPAWTPKATTARK